MATKDEHDEKVRGWFTGRLPEGWFEGDGAGSAVEVVIDRAEIAGVGRIPAPAVAADVSPTERAAAVEGKIKGFREDTRDRRIAIAREAEHRFGRKVAWGVECDDLRVLFTHLSVPVMTRLRQPQRRVLDTLVEAGVARSRSDALAWCVRLVGKHAEEWLTELRSAMEQVDRVRAQGPDSAAADSPAAEGQAE
jgi:hypothetical protein